MMPIFIPSIGKPNSNNSKIFPDSILFVQPQEYEEYKQHNPTAIIKILPENDRGISYARECILEYATRRRIETFSILDDELQFSYNVTNHKIVKSKPMALLVKVKSIFLKKKSEACHEL
jgi:hypothetical protein